jgi:hypothetical protein
LVALRASGASAEDAVAWDDFGHAVLVRPVPLAVIQSGFVRAMAEGTA